MKIRDMHAQISGDDTVYDMPSGGVEILADDGETLICVSFGRDGEIDISSGGSCKHRGVVLDKTLIIIPRATNSIVLKREAYK